MKLFELFDGKLYVQMRDEGFVRRQVHPALPLAILNYSEKAQFAQEWNDVTLNCRGLIYNYETEEIVARAFKKFFNWDDSSQKYPPHGPVLRSPKMDGSLGILYQTGDEYVPWAVATRGSFVSDQAQWATNKLYKLHQTEELNAEDLIPGYSYLVELIYPDNRIVVNYGAQERLVLLDVLNTATGKTDLTEFERVYWLDKVDRRYFPGGFTDGFVHDIPEGEEGFVVYWPSQDYRVKMKAAEYLELHRMIFSLSERSVWARLGEGESVEEICVKLPDEFHGWVKSVGERLNRELEEVVAGAEKEYKVLSASVGTDRKAFASKAVRSPLRAYLFMLFDGKDIREAVWKTLRPEGNKGVITISEDVA